MIPKDEITTKNWQADITIQAPVAMKKKNYFDVITRDITLDMSMITIMIMMTLIRMSIIKNLY